MVAGEFFPVNGFDARDLVVCQRGEFPFPPAARKRAAVLVEEPEQEIRQALRHIDDQVQVVPKCVVPPQKCCFLRQVQFDSPLHASVQELGLRRGIEIPVEIAGIVQYPDSAVFRRFLLHHRQQALRVIFERCAVVVDPVQNRRRYRKCDPRRVESALGQDVVNQVTVQPAVPVVERMDVDKAKGQDLCG